MKCTRTDSVYVRNVTPVNFWRLSYGTRVVHGLGQPTGWVGLGWVEIFWLLVGWVGSWVRNGRNTKIKSFICFWRLSYGRNNVCKTWSVAWFIRDSWVSCSQSVDISKVIEDKELISKLRSTFSYHVNYRVTTLRAIATTFYVLRCTMLLRHVLLTIQAASDPARCVTFHYTPV